MGFSLARLRSLPRKMDAFLNSTVLFGADPLADLSILEAGLATRTVTAESRSEERIVQRILAAYREAKRDQTTVPQAYRPGGEWDHWIKTERGEYVAALERQDVEELSRLLRNFFRNSGICGLWTHGYYGEIAAAGARRKRWFVHSLLQDYAAWKDLTGNTDPHALAAPSIGNAWGCVIDGQLVMPVACRHHYFAHQARALLLDVPGTRVVAEIGGGFGGAAFFLLSTLDRCRYIDFDLPEILIIQQYYLMSAFPEKTFLLYGEGPLDAPGTLENYDVILQPNFQLPKLPDKTVDFFINTGSLSEMDYPTVKEYIAQITRTCRLYFFHDNSDRAVSKKAVHVEVPSSHFPIPQSVFKRIYKAKSPWGGMGDDRMREHLYQRRSVPVNCG